MSSMVELGWSTYEFEEIRSIKELREIFPNEVADQWNWVLLSQKCFHGTSDTLDDIEKIILGAPDAKARPIDGKWAITVLVICTRTTVIKWGYIDVGINDIEFLRKLVKSTLEIIPETQKGNI